MIQVVRKQPWKMVRIVPNSGLAHVRTRRHGTIVRTPVRCRISLSLAINTGGFNSGSLVYFGTGPNSSAFLSLVTSRIASVSLGNGSLSPTITFRSGHVRLASLGRGGRIAIRTGYHCSGANRNLRHSISPSSNGVCLCSRFRIPSTHHICTIFSRPSLGTAFSFGILTPTD